MILQLFHSIADNKAYLTAAIILEVVAGVGMHQRLQSLKETFQVGNPPDLWFGVPSSKLSEYLEALGPDGRNAYELGVNNWDFFPYIPAYTILLGSLLVQQCQVAKMSTSVAWIVPWIMLCDIVESALFGYITRQYPQQVDPAVVMTASLANQLKWISFLIVCTTFIALFARRLRRSKEKPHSN